jgi:UDP-N-acetylmuramate: L-alanyl-gamma-D-glutamyl-meso-diaminopimelate ligase
MIHPQSIDPAPAVDLGKVHRIYLLGIGGTGMGAFAGLLKQAGYEVAGSDEALYPPMSEMLERWNIQALRGYEAGHLRQPFNADPDLVVVGNVIRRLNPEAETLRQSGIPYLSFPQALGEIFLASRESIVIAGTHGKTTTSALVAHLLTQAGRDPSALIGGVSLNLLEEGGGSFRIGKGRHFVVEGDEYDTAYFDKGPKFLHYRPKLAVLTSLEFDHADIYRDLPHYESAFARFLALLPDNGHLAVAEAQPRAMSLGANAACRVETYGIGRGDLQAKVVSFKRDGAHFEMWRRDQKLGVFHFPIFGAQNLENALGAASVALAAGLSPEELKAGLATFRGVRRRQEILGTPRGITIIDDFAHHPTAVRATLAAVRTRFPDQHLWALFEPRSNTSRRKIYQVDYSEAFDLADRVVIAAPQGGSPVPESERLDPQALANAIAQRGKDAHYSETIDALVERIAQEAKPGEVVLLMSNGSFGGLAQKLMGRLARP